MNKNDVDKVTPRERIYLLNEIAERDKIIQEQREEIAYYKRQTEIAIQRRFKDRHNRSERRKDIITAAVLLLIVSCVFLPMCVMAFRETVLWAAGM